MKVAQVIKAATTQIRRFGMFLSFPSIEYKYFKGLERDVPGFAGFESQILDSLVGIGGLEPAASRRVGREFEGRGRIERDLPRFIRGVSKSQNGALRDQAA